MIVLRGYLTVYSPTGVVLFKDQPVGGDAAAALSDLIKAEPAEAVLFTAIFVDPTNKTHITAVLKSGHSSHLRQV